jgi:hypothetical protein
MLLEIGDLTALFEVAVGAELSGHGLCRLEVGWVPLGDLQYVIGALEEVIEVVSMPHLIEFLHRPD